MSIQEQFEAAVKVIQNLPKNGPYQPSNEMMLQFYSYYKQATQGPCTIPKPAFWDIVNKAKWNAWSGLGQMEKEEAMRLYVDEIKKIIETMSLSTDVEKFLEVLGPFYEYVKDEDSGIELESNGMSALIGKFTEQLDEDKLNLFTSRTNLLNDQINSAQKILEQDKSEFAKLKNEEPETDVEDQDEMSDDLSEMIEPKLSPKPLEDLEVSEDDEDLFEDPLEELSTAAQLHSTRRTGKSEVVLRVQQLQGQLDLTVERLQKDMDHVMARMATLEKLAAATMVTNKPVPDVKPKVSSGIPFSELSGPTTLLLIVWPFAVQGIISLIKSKRS